MWSRPAIADDVRTVLALNARGHHGKYPNDLGYRQEIARV